jgi:hypothetical protein
VGHVLHQTFGVGDDAFDIAHELLFSSFDGATVFGQIGIHHASWCGRASELVEPAVAVTSGSH